MDPKLQRRVQRYGWDRAAEHYDTGWRRQLEPAQRLLLETAALEPGERVVDIACGTGLVTFPAAEAVWPEGEVVGTDLSQEMVTRVSEAARRRGLQNVTSTRMGAEDLQLPDASFDVALCALGFMYYPDPDLAAREMHRVLKTDGRAVVAVWGARENCGWAEVFPIVDARVDTDVCPLFYQLGTGGAMARTLEAAGFSDIDATRISTVLRYADDEEACTAAFAGGPVAMAYERFDEETRREAHAEYVASIAAYRVNGRYEIPGEFVVARGFKRPR